jgi:broad specificity polyphosphatase/5'/3'-nucleotidase SurE
MNSTLAAAVPALITGVVSLLASHFDRRERKSQNATNAHMSAMDARICAVEAREDR